MQITNSHTDSRQGAGAVIARTAAIAAMLSFFLFTGAASASDHRSNREKESRSYESEIYGTVEKLPGDLIGTWTVSGRDIVVTRDTRIKQGHGKPEPGASVKIEGSEKGKIFTAYEIEVKRSGQR